MNDLAHLSDQEIQQQLGLLQRQQKIQLAREHLADFLEFMMPDPEYPEDVTKTEYQRAPHALLLCDLMEKMERGDYSRVAVTIPPQHGKTIHISQYGLAWIWGRNPRVKIIVATYNQDRADELGDTLRSIVRHKNYEQVFPDLVLDSANRSKSYLKNEKGGSITFAGARAAITGKTGDYFVIDDPYKGDDDEFTPAMLERTWSWFFKVAYSRGSNRTRMFVVHTRWLEDDLIGRLCDPSHPEREKRFKGIADDWLFLNLPGVIQEKPIADMLGLELELPLEPRVVAQFGAKPTVALWEREKDLSFFARWKLGDPRSFSALVMGRPTPDDGLYFQAEWLEEYDESELPSDLAIYGASDHAVSEKQQRDPNVIGCAGIDQDDTMWILPTVTIEKMETDRLVEELIRQMQMHRPVVWWMESELISKSFGPFLRTRMNETRTYVALDPVTPSKEKRTRARSIQGRMAMGKVKFPRFAPWWPDAKAQLLRFPYASNDDFVDFLSLLGNGLDKQYGAPAPRPQRSNVVKVGSWEWIRGMSKKRDIAEKRRNPGW